MEGVCVWESLDEFSYDYYKVHKSFTLHLPYGHSSNQENRFIFCPFCGKRIVFDDSIHRNIFVEFDNE